MHAAGQGRRHGELAAYWPHREPKNPNAAKVLTGWRVLGGVLALHRRAALQPRAWQGAQRPQGGAAARAEQELRPPVRLHQKVPPNRQAGENSKKTLRVLLSVGLPKSVTPR